MTWFASVYSFGLACAVILAWLLIFALTYLLFAPRSRTKDEVQGFLSAYGLWLAFLIALAATLGSLFYSGVIGFPVCDLCWYQRIFMYPLVFLCGIAAWRRDQSVALYGIVLSLLGALFALYHVALQMLQLYGVAELPCSADPGMPACSSIYVLEFGFVSIPLMALASFVFVLLLCMWVRRGAAK
jgi:disulfide bond formation protein DsbB